MEVVRFERRLEGEAREAMVANARTLLRMAEYGDAMAIAFAVVDRQRAYHLCPCNADGYLADLCVAVRSLDREVFEALFDDSVVAAPT